jgi:hypothetical protein
MKTTASVSFRRESGAGVELTYLPLKSKRRILIPNQKLTSSPPQTDQNDSDLAGVSNGPHVRYLLLTLGAGFCIALIMYVLILILLYA